MRNFKKDNNDLGNAIAVIIDYIVNAGNGCNK